jgi:hypothetical protein
VTPFTRIHALYSQARIILGQNKVWTFHEAVAL